MVVTGVVSSAGGCSAGGSSAGGSSAGGSSAGGSSAGGSSAGGSSTGGTCSGHGLTIMFLSSGSVLWSNCVPLWPSYASTSA
ncbi:hypothetical protein CKY47_27615 [Saccharothrix yanglingensis]|uniref:Secreted protein n=1 Tax=Saccharothrix yanglingensis TaxID=659496 RepID=A0ABU0XAM9_9PSEU|nr:hypothetical protein [Saccharothrix yanglingensis]